MNYHHLSIEERSCIRKYYVDGLSYREIVRLIGRNVSTISRETRRNCTHMYDIPTYYPHTAQKKYLLRRSYCHRGMFHSSAISFLLSSIVSFSRVIFVKSLFLHDRLRLLFISISRSTGVYRCLTGSVGTAVPERSSLCPPWYFWISTTIWNIRDDH